MILGHLRSTRGDIASLAVNADALTTRVGLREEHVAGLPRDLVLIHGDMAAMSQRLDHHERHLERVGKGLELAD